MMEENPFEEKFYFLYDEFCDLLGGAAWEQAIQSWLLSGSLYPDRHQRLQALSVLRPSSNQFLFPHDPTGHSLLERLWLKWNLFKSLCHEVRIIYKEQKRPWLNIQPTQVRVRIPDRVTHFLPARWQFSVKTEEHKFPAPFTIPHISSQQALWFYNAPDHPHRIYSSPILQERPLGYDEIVTALIRSIEQICEPTQEGLRGLLEIQLVSENIRPAEYSEKDLFCVRLRLPDTPDPPVSVWATKAASLERGLLLKGITEPLDPHTWEKIEKARQSVFSHTTVIIYKTYHLPCDLYSLGMMLFRTLLVNDEQDMTGVDQVVRHIATSLGPMVQGLDPQDTITLSSRFQVRLKKEADLFSKNAILYLREERKASHEIIPDYIWYDTLILAFRLITLIPGFSFFKNHGDYEIEDLHGPMEKVIGTVERLEHWMKIELFGVCPRNQEILKACDLIRGELTQGASK